MTKWTQSHCEYQLAERCPKAGLLVSADEDNLLTMCPALTIERLPSVSTIRQKPGSPGSCNLLQMDARLRPSFIRQKEMFTAEKPRVAPLAFGSSRRTGASDQSVHCARYSATLAIER